MIKKLLLGIVLLGCVVLAAVYFFGSSALNSGVKKGVETFGPKVTQTSVTLDSVNLSPLFGSGSLKGLVVGNPEGFKSENIFSLGQIDIKVDTGSIFSDTIVIDKIHIKQPGISYEKKLTTSNVKELQKNIEAFTGPRADAPTDQAEDSGAKKQLVIRELIIEDGTIFVGALGVGQTVPLPRIEMTDIGEGGKRMTVAQTMDLILTKVLSNIGPAIANAGELGKEAANALKTQGLEKVDQATDKAGEAVKDGINKLFGN